MKKLLNLLAVILSISLLFSCGKNAVAKNEKTTSTAKSYHGVAAGYNGNIEVDVTIDNSMIKNVKITKESESPGIDGPLYDSKRNLLTNGGESPITLIPKMIVDKQSINVDAVSGATATSYGILHAVSPALIDANYRVDAVTAATEVVNSDYKPAEVNLTKEEKEILDKWLIKANLDTIHEDQTCDVAIIGGGGAGLAAAISASENEANVIVIEKNGEVGGDTLVCGAIYNAPDEKLQKKLTMNKAKEEVIKKALNETPVNDEHRELIEQVKTQLDEHNKKNANELFDSKEWFALQTYNGGDKKANLSLVKALCYNSYDSLTWIKNIGVSFYDFISQGAGSLWERTHTNTMPMGTGFISNYLNKISKDDKIKILTNTSAISIKNDGSDRVNIVECKDKYGNVFKIHANKSIVIATGGFSANKILLNTYNKKGESKWSDIDLSSLPTTNRKTVSTGAGIEMGLNVGADTVDMSEIQLLYLGNLKNGDIIKGLYAAGEVTGGIHGGNRLDGNAVVGTVVFGKIAGKNAALEE